MNITFTHKRLVIVSIIIFASVALFTKCIDKEHPPGNGITNLKGQAYAGTASCRNCHREIYDSFKTTLHHLESAPASEENIKGSFLNSKNILYLDSNHWVVMKKQAGSLYQVAYANGKEQRAEKFDIVIGTGKHG